MASSDDKADEEELYGTAELNDRGRLTFPKPLREDLQLEGGTEFRVVRDGSEILLVRGLPELRTLIRNGEWGEEAFPDVGRSTFGKA